MEYSSSNPSCLIGLDSPVSERGATLIEVLLAVVMMALVGLSVSLGFNA